MITVSFKAIGPGGIPYYVTAVTNFAQVTEDMNRQHDEGRYQVLLKDRDVHFVCKDEYERLCRELRERDKTYPKVAGDTIEVPHE